MTGRPIRIGTRDSVLATWQARFVLDHLTRAGRKAELRFIKTEGDRVLDTPLPMMGGKGVFTKALDEALLSGDIDLAVHSLKDIPTRLPDGLTIGAVSEREDTADVLVTRDAAKHYLSDKRDDFHHQAAATPVFSDDPHFRAVIASSSNRRIGQWLARYPLHRMTDIRGNVQTRLRKLAENDWDGAIFAAAGLIRLGLDHVISKKLDWMLPAPAQGAMAVMIRRDDKHIHEAIQGIHDPDTALCTTIERDVLHALEGGCSAPVGALAVVDDRVVRLRVNTVYPDGTGLIQFDMIEQIDLASDLGKRAADEALRLGADALIRDLRGGMEADEKKNTDQIQHTTQNHTRSQSPASSTPPASSSARPRIVLSTRLAESADVALAKKHNILLIDYPVWIYRRVTPPSDVIDALCTGSQPDAWVFTSRRGVEGWWHVWKERGAVSAVIPPIYAVGPATADAVRKTFSSVDIRLPQGGDGLSLGEAMARDGIRSAVHFCAAERRRELMEVSRKHNITLTEAVVYERRSVINPKPLNVVFDAILFYSPDGVSEFCRIYGVPGGDWHAIAVGKTTAEAVRRITGREPHIPESPAFDEMIKLVSYRL